MTFKLKDSKDNFYDPRINAFVQKERPHGLHLKVKLRFFPIKCAFFVFYNLYV